METTYSKKTYRLAKGSLAPLIKLVFRPEVIGQNLIPEEGPFILAGNHKSLLDIPLVAIASKKDIRFIAKEELFKTTFSNYIFTKLGAIPIKRGQADLKAIRTSIDILKNNEILGIFPEGTRHKGEGLGEFKSGTSLLAVKADCPIIPFGISGEYKIGKKIRIQFGEAIRFKKSDLKEGTADQILEEQVKKLIK